AWTTIEGIPVGRLPDFGPEIPEKLIVDIDNDGSDEVLARTYYLVRDAEVALVSVFDSGHPYIASPTLHHLMESGSTDQRDDLMFSSFPGFMPPGKVIGFQTGHVPMLHLPNGTGIALPANIQADVVSRGARNYFWVHPIAEFKASPIPSVLLSYDASHRLKIECYFE